MPVRREWELNYGVDDVLRSQSADPAAIRARRPRLVELSQRALDEGRDLVEPIVDKGKAHDCSLTRHSHKGPAVTNSLPVQAHLEPYPPLYRRMR